MADKIDRSLLLRDEIPGTIVSTGLVCRVEGRDGEAKDREHMAVAGQVLKVV